MGNETDGVVVLRHIHASFIKDDCSENRGSESTTDVVPFQREPPQNGNSAAESDIEVSHTNEREKENLGEAITLPESTHTMLFSEPMLSLPFIFSIIIAAMSFMCLFLALINNLSGTEDDNPLDVPANVDPTVKAAQYLSIFVVLLMEEEIPTGLYLLRMISKQSLSSKFPRMSYNKFVVSAILRILQGYTFLFNVFVVVVQAEAVLDIFYDVLALEFVQKLDDIAFQLSKMDVLGQSMKKATTRECFKTEFYRKQFGYFKRISFFLKGVYFANLFLMLFGVAAVSMYQNAGVYHCDSITVTFSDDVWEDAIVRNNDGEYYNMMLLYSYFNGVYEREGSHDGRPRYVERRKFDGNPYESKIGAEIKFCKEESSWIFTHENIRKSHASDENDCPWLLKSPETSGYDLLEISGHWSLWKGIVVKDADLVISCNSCSDDSDCNFNGVCDENGECQCYSEFSGTLCEHREPCNTIKGGLGDTWSVVLLENSRFRYYGRPLFVYVGGLNETIFPNAMDSMQLVYSGSRWFGRYFEYSLFKNMSTDEVLIGTKEYHPFFDKVYGSDTVFVSNPTTRSSPVTVDFFWVEKRGDQYGPFGVLQPMQEPVGSGYYFCVNNSTDPMDFVELYESFYGS